MNRREWKDAWRAARRGQFLGRELQWIQALYWEAMEEDDFPPKLRVGDNGRILKRDLLDKGLPLTWCCYFRPIPLP